MKYQETQHRFYELLDEWKAYHEAARDMRAKVTEAFSGVAKGGSVTPSLGVLAVLESLEGTSKNRRFQPATVSSGLKSSGLPVL